MAAACCLGASAVALWIGAAHRVGTFGVETDFYWHFGPEARDLLAGRPSDFPFHPPGYSLLLAAFSFVTADLFTAAKVVSAIATGALGWLTYRLVKSLVDARMALASALFTMVAVFAFSFQASSDVVGAALMVLPSWVLLRRRTPSTGSVLTAGMTAGAAYLVRTNGLAVIAGLAVSLLVGIGTPRILKSRVADCGIFLLGTLLTIAPGLAVRWASSGHVFASENYLQVAAHFYLRGGERNSTTALQQAAQQFHSPWEVLSYEPGLLLRKYVRNVLWGYPRSLLLQLLRIPAAIVAAVGLFALARRISRRWLPWLLPCLFGYLLLGLVGFQLRYYFFLLPLVSLLLVAGLFQLSMAVSLLESPWSPASVGWGLTAVFLVIFGVRAFRSARAVFDAEPRYLIRIAEVLRARSSPNDRMIVRKPHLAFLAGLRLVQFPLAENAEDFLDAARQERARYVAYSDEEVKLWPGLRSLSDPNVLPVDFELVYRDEPSKTLVYEVCSIAARRARGRQNEERR